MKESNECASNVARKNEKQLIEHYLCNGTSFHSDAFTVFEKVTFFSLKNLCNKMFNV